MLKPVEKPIKFKKNAATLGKTYPVTHIEAVIDGNGKTLPDILELMLSTIPSTSGDIMSYTDSEGNTRYIASTDDPSGIVGGGGMTELTWLELKTLRDNSQLAAGSFYRITDYNCTTTQENTQSAGHQFDIVLLALSENKLAEEGWAMMHIDNIYKVVFDDNEVVSCYVTPIENQANRYYLVNVDTLLGTDITITSDRKDEDNKVITLVGGWTPDVLDTPDLPYNYFQNSNLSAWKVWYCLDNDKSRFAWADDSVDEDVIEIRSLIGADNKTYTANGTITVDGVERVRYKPSDAPYRNMVTIEEPMVGVTIYGTTIVGSSAKLGAAETTITSIDSTVIHEGTGLPNGRGVIYRLIDEWNNDVACDFKNIQFIRPMVDGYYDPEGEDTWVYTISDISSDNDLICDDSIRGYMKNTTIERSYDYEGCSILGNNVIIGSAPIGGNIRIFGNDSTGNTIANSAYITMYNDNGHLIMAEEGAMYIAGKKVLTET